MSVILVADQDASRAQRISEVLRSHGLDVATVGSRSEALRHAEASAPKLLLANSGLPEASALCSAFSRTRGGPGAIVLTAASLGATASDFQADEHLTTPFSDEDLWRVVQSSLEKSPQRQTASPRASPASEQLTSADIFGDVLAEVEAEALNKSPAPRSQSANPVDDIERRLEETLSGVIAPAGRQPASAVDGATETTPQPGTPGDSEIDDLLDKTLSSLDIPTRGKKLETPVPPETPVRPAPLKAEPTPEASAPATQVDLAAEVVEPVDAPSTDTPESVATSSSPDTTDATGATGATGVAGATETTEPAAVAGSLDIDDPPAMGSQHTFEPLPSIDPEPPAEPAITPNLESSRWSTEVPPEPSGPTPGESLAAEPSISPLAAEELPESGPATGSSATPPSVQPEADLFRTRTLPTLVPGQELSAGENFGDYVLLDRIALGGMAEVWRARRRGVEGFQKTVAIKKILSHLTGSPDFVTMFIDEAKLAAQLSHNNIIQIYDLGKVGNDFFIAMEYVDGKDLRSILTAAEESQRPIPVGLGLQIIGAVARALDYAHRKRDFENRALGLVHRDVSPQNVLLSYEGEIKLCDFGIVKAVAKASTTQMGALKGKLQYMSPEQAWGKRVDARSDIFSLGAVLYEVLTGTKLFSGDSEIGVLDAVRDCRIRSPRELTPEIPKLVEQITLKALAKKPEERYQTAGEMEHELKAALDELKPTPSTKDLAAFLDDLFAPRKTTAQTATPQTAKPQTATPQTATPQTATPQTATPRTAEAAPPATEAPTATGSEPAARQAPAPEATQASAGSSLKWVLAAGLAAGLAGGAFLMLNSADRRAGGTTPQPAVESDLPASSSSVADEAVAVGAETTEATASPAETSAPGGATPGSTEPGSEPAPPASAADEASEADEATEAEPEPPAGPLNIEQMVNEELESRAERLRRDFEAERRRLEKELEEAQREDLPDDPADEGEEPPDGGESSADPDQGGGGRDDS